MSNEEQSLVLNKMALQLSDIHAALPIVVKTNGHFEKMDLVLNTGFATVVTVLTELKTGLLTAAVGKDHIPRETVDSLLNRTDQITRFVYKILGLVILTLITVIGLLLTGDNFGFIKALH